MSVTINFDEKSTTKLDLDGDGKIDHVTVIADSVEDGSAKIVGTVYIDLAKDGFSKDTLITASFSETANQCDTMSAGGQLLRFECHIDAETIAKKVYGQAMTAKTQMQRQQLDKEIAENAGVLGALRDNRTLDSALDATGLNADDMKGMGGLIGTKGTQIGSGGLGARGSGLGDGGTAESLGGLGTKGRGSGASGYGSGGGGFGATGIGGIGTVGSDPIILGALDKSLIDAVIKRNMAQIRYCYQCELTKNPTLGGKITVKVVIAKDGTVSSAVIKTGTGENGQAFTSWNNSEAGQKIGEAICERFLKFQFPQPKGGGIVIVNYPFIFSPG